MYRTYKQRGGMEKLSTVGKCLAGGGGDKEQQQQQQQQENSTALE